MREALRLRLRLRAREQSIINNQQSHPDVYQQAVVAVSAHSSFGHLPITNSYHSLLCNEDDSYPFDSILCYFDCQQWDPVSSNEKDRLPRIIIIFPP